MTDELGLDKFVPFQGQAVAGADEQLLLNDRALQQVKTAYTTAVAVQKPRTIAAVAKNVLEESRLAGSSFYYRWQVKNKSTGRTSTVQGPSVDLAMCIARNYGNCVVDIEGTETKTHYMLKGIFIDLETGFTVPRLYRQSKSQNIGGGYGDDRAQDIVFQIAQSKAQRNAIVKAMPAWLIDRAIEVAREAEISHIKPENLELAKARVLEFFAGYGVTADRIEEKIERPVNQWTAEDIVDLRAAATALKEGRISPNELFPAKDGQTEETEDLAGKILKGEHGDKMEDEDTDMGKTQDKPDPAPNPFDDRAKWINFRSNTNSLATYYKINKQMWFDASDKIRVEFVDKWEKFYSEPPPPLDPEQDQPPESQGQKPQEAYGGKSAGQGEAEYLEAERKLKMANVTYLKRRQTSPDIWAAAVKNAQIENPEFGLADLDEADRFDACFLEVIEAG